MRDVHWTLARLIDLTRGVLDASERRAAEEHLAGCARCREDQAWARSLERALREGPLAEPPARLVEKAYALFPRPLRQESPGLAARLRALVATLVRDSAIEPLPAGVRAGTGVPRQLLFEAGSVDIDLKLLPGESGRTMSLYGQVAPRDPQANASALEVRLVPEEGGNRSTKTNEFGEFVFEDLPEGGFAVAVSFEGTVLTLGPVHPSNTF